MAAVAFHPTVLVGMRNLLRASDRPRRLFEDVNTAARAAGLLRGRRPVLDSTPLFGCGVLAELETRIAALGYRRVYLTTGTRQPEAEALYTAVGYTRLAQARMPEPHFRALAFEKVLER